jgi:2-polyprenyl-3-methyl-5-hydroxy-6-metoxy-1,4-benzoquinol methylase
MINSPMEMRALSIELGTSLWTHTAIAALFESGLVEHLREPRTIDELARLHPAMSRTRIARLVALVQTTGVIVAEGERYRLADGAIPFASPPMRAVIEGDLRSQLMQAIRFLDGVRSGPQPHGWSHTDRTVLQAQGDASTGFVPMFRMGMLPQLGDLAARLEREDAAMLDVGVGVGALAIAMCRAFPKLRVVGLDTVDPPLAIAREKVAAAGLDGRIELRKLAVEQLADTSVFDIAWLPSFFIAETVLPAAVERTFASLRPGGWLLFPTMAPPSGERTGSALALVADLWGGPAMTGAEAEALLRRAGHPHGPHRSGTAVGAGDRRRPALSAES